MRGIQRSEKRSSSADTAGSTSSAFAPALGGEYEVFLSFRGEDICKTFTDYLYHDLVDADIHTFRDNDELRVGEAIGTELLKAIQESKIYIPIFSRDYASSKWCLLELAQMVDCGKHILPIFYDVTPSQVRHQMGTYEGSFHEHQNLFDKKIVQQWKDALKKVDEKKGWELKKDTNG
jgi:hypothetical protein